MPNLVELPLLGVLREYSLHGYELKRHVESLTGYPGTLSFGSLYPMLRALKHRGCVTRKEGWQSGRLIHRYSITTKGEKRFIQLMNDPGVALTQKLLFFQAIPPINREQILQGHIKEWKNKLDRSQLEKKRIDKRSVDRYRAVLLDREIDHLTRDIEWLQRLIDEEAASSVPPRNNKISPRRPLKRSQ